MTTGAPIPVAVAMCRGDEEEALVRKGIEDAVGDRVTLRFSSSKADLLECLKESEILLTLSLSPELLHDAPHLKWVHLAVAGVERSVTPELKRSSVVMTSSRGMHRVKVAEHVLGLMLTFAKRLNVAAEAQSRRHWAYDEISTSNFSLAGLTCGILGLGAIGLEVARLAGAFGMRCIGTRRRPFSEGESLPEGLRLGLGESHTDRILAESDFLVLALPLTDRTRGLLDRRRLGLMKRSAHLINIARGALLDEEAMLEALREGRLAGAGLDVFVNEPVPPDSPIWTTPGVVLTPHISGNYPEYMVDSTRVFVANLQRYLRGEALDNVVDHDLGY